MPILFFSRKYSLTLEDEIFVSIVFYGLIAGQMWISSAGIYFYFLISLIFSPPFIVYSETIIPSKSA